MAEEQVHKRRVRYKGTHPRNYKEKYKELNPEKYKDDVEKIMKKGKTPAGMHISIMVNEILEVLQIKPGETGYDATLGYGGHTRKMLEQLKGEGHMFATDVDPIESVKTKKRLEEAYAYAEENGFDYFTTVMTFSRQKDSQKINEIGKALMQKYPNTKYFFSDFKKDNGQLKSNEIAEEYCLYKQNYCGCIYSLPNEDQNK